MARRYLSLRTSPQAGLFSRVIYKYLNIMMYHHVHHSLSMYIQLTCAWLSFPVIIIQGISRNILALIVSTQGSYFAWELSLKLFVLRCCSR